MGTSDIDFNFSNPDTHLSQRKPSPKGHVIAARITAENPEAGFKPNSGRILELNFRSSSNVWGYFSVNSYGGIHEYADSQFGHVFSYGMTREESRRNMIMALKELSIRGDFRTTVEYLIKLLETKDFAENTVHTGWLDSLIARRLETEKPDLMVAVICGGVVQVVNRHAEDMKEYERQLERGQVPSKTLLRTNYFVEFIYDNIQYRMNVLVAGPELYRVSCNKSYVEVMARKMADDGVLILLDGKSHLAYAKEEAVGISLQVDGKTCLLEKENDPTKLRSPSPGKLVRYLIEDGEHVKDGETFAEIEVMKMYMPLVASESGIVRFMKQAGSVLKAGDVIGIMTLDDPSRVQHAEKFVGQLPSFGPPQVIGEKVHHQYRFVKSTIEHLLDGYDNLYVAQNNVRTLIEFLRNNDLPYLELQELLSSLSGRIPAKLESSLRECYETARTGNKVFPAAQLKTLMDNCKSEMNNKDETTAFTETSQLVYYHLEKYLSGLKLHERFVIVSLLEKFFAVEKVFDEVRYDDVILRLREQHRSELQQVSSIALSNSKVVQKCELVLQLLDQVRTDNDGSEEWKSVFLPVLGKLANLNSRSTNSIAIRARELLVYYELPTYKERHNSVFSLLQKSVARYDDLTVDFEEIAKLVTSNYAILDVLPSYFHHEDKRIQVAAIYTYILHTHQAYSVKLIRHSNHDFGIPVVFWEFTLRRDVSRSTLPKAHTNPMSPVYGSFPDLTGLAIRAEKSSLERQGLMLPFESLKDMEERLPNVLATMSKETDTLNFDSRRLVLNVVFKSSILKGLNGDDHVAIEKLTTAVGAIRHELQRWQVGRITFVLVRENKFPLFFTYRRELEYDEDQIIRHVEPAMAYQLELHRLLNFNIKPCFVNNRRIHVYYGVAKKNPSDARFFVRALVYPGQLSQNISTKEYLTSEGHRTMTAIMDALEMVRANEQNYDCNHLFINFVPTFILEVPEVENAIREFITRHGLRLFKLRVTHAEIRFLIQSSPLADPKAYRFAIVNVSGFVTKIETYVEVKDDKGDYILKSLNHPPESLHHTPVNALYTTKESIQPKRYKAHLMGTTYVYDFPDMFKSALEKIWIQYVRARPGVHMPGMLMNCVELVLDTKGCLQKIERPLGMIE